MPDLGLWGGFFQHITSCIFLVQSIFYYPDLRFFAPPEIGSRVMVDSHG